MRFTGHLQVAWLVLGAVDVANCSKCAAFVADWCSFCPHCGASLTATWQSVPSRLVVLAPKPRWSTGKIIGCSFLGFVLLSGLLNLLHPDPESSSAAAEEKRAQLRRALDAPASAQFTPFQHLQEARRLLTQIDINDYEKSDVLIQLVLEHAMEAAKQPKLKAQADDVIQRDTVKGMQAIVVKAWKDPQTEIMARAVAKQFIEKRLKTSSTANWISTESGRWEGHPGYFIVAMTVDAQNSLGAKLRTKYECQVACRSSEACQVSKMYPH